MAKDKKLFPGFKLTLGYTLLYLSLIVLIPLSVMFWKTTELSLDQFWQTISDKRVLLSFRLSFTTALVAAGINAVFGTIIAWVLVRYTFPGKRIIDGLVDLPFALPTAVAGIALTAIYSQNGWVGKLIEPLGWKIAYTPIGIVVALTFIGLPFVVRTIQPVLHDFERQYEEAAASLGANRWQIIARVIFPAVFPAIITGFALAFARGVGEYGSVVFISGNMPFKTEIVPLLIVTKLEQYDYPGATALATVMLVVSFLLLFIINVWQWRVSRKWL